jgi:hypothetical protein
MARLAERQLLTVISRQGFVAPCVCGAPRSNHSVAITAMRSESRSSGCRVRRRSVLLFCLFFSATVATLFLIRGGKSAVAADTAPVTRTAAAFTRAAVAPTHHGSTPRSASVLDASAAVEYLAAKFTATANDLKRANLVRRHRGKLMLDYTAATDFSRERYMYEFTSE